ncbi:MAG: hypothetical protein ACPGWR_09025 [Ardenticatenaceae bacterium]
MKYTPVHEAKIKIIVIYAIVLIICVSVYDLFFIFASLICIFVEIAKYASDSSRWNKFKSSPKETTQAKIVNRRVIESKSGKGATSYTHYITYQFEDLAHGTTFTFEEEVSKTDYNSVSIGKLLTVEYAIADPRLARRRYSNL